MSGIETAGRLRKYRPDVQGLRALAIAMVVTWHVGLLNIHGGVDVSFVLSGFLIGSQLLAEIGRTGKVSLGKFWARRFRRLVPGMAIVVIATIAFSWLYASPLRFRGYATDGIYAVFSALNWRLAENGTDYFQSSGSQTPYQHFWSLGIEEQFYVAAPLLLVAAAWLSRKIFRNRALIAAFLVAIVIGSFYLSVTQTQSDQPLAYFGTHTRAWELAIGLLLALGAQWLSRMNLVVAAVMSWVGLIGAIATAMLITDKTPLPGYAIAGPVLGAALVIAGGCANPSFGAEWVLGRRIPDLVGKVSYGWYLWHWPLLILWPDIVGRSMNFADRFRIAGLSLFLAVVMFYAIEKRVRARQHLVSIPWRGLLAGMATTAVTAAVMAVALAAPLNLQTPPATAASDTVGVVGSESVKLAANQQRLPSNVQPRLVDAADDRARQGCIDDLVDRKFVMRQDCVIGDAKGDRTIVLFGDSHAYQWGETLNTMGQSEHYRVITVTKAGCSPTAYAVYNPNLKRTYTECDMWRASALAAIIKLRPEAAIMTGRIQKGLKLGDAKRTYDKLWESGAKLVYLTDTPYPNKDIPDCLATHGDMKSCVRKTADTLDLPQLRDMERRAAEQSGAAVVDVVPVFCTESVCPPVIGGRIVYYDYSHMTATYAKALAPWLVSVLRVALS